LALTELLEELAGTLVARYTSLGKKRSSNHRKKGKTEMMSTQLEAQEYP
jgi:hypothetical protein